MYALVHGNKHYQQLSLSVCLSVCLSLAHSLSLSRGRVGMRKGVGGRR